jgi:hypothetical protein
LSGHAFGLPSSDIIQTDELSGGQTETEIPDLEDTSPMEGETMYGRFTALAETGFTLSGNQGFPTDAFTRVALRISTPRGRKVLKFRNVDTARGVAVPALVPGNYIATWKLIDVNGDTRVIQTRFIEQPGRRGAGPKAKVACGSAGGSSIRCRVSFPHNGFVKGTLRIRLTRGGTVVALGHGRVSHSRAVLTMRELRQVSSGKWLATIVLSRFRVEPVTIRVALNSVALARDPGSASIQRVPLARAWERISDRMRSSLGSA